MARQWAGQDAALAAKDEEIKRLREIIHKHVWDLRFKYRDDEKRMTRRLERAPGGR